MRRVVCVLLFGIVLVFAKAQTTAEVLIAQLGNESSYQWSLYNSSDELQISSANFRDVDSVFTELEANSRFFLRVTVDEVAASDSLLLSLSVNNNPILIVASSLEKGDHRYPFVTGASTPQLRIIGGKDAAISSVPWQACFFSGDYLCGGSIIGSRWILTAAHCAFDSNGNRIDKADMVIVVGTAKPFDGKTGTAYRVRTAILYDDYNKNDHTGDLLLLELDDVIDFETASSIALMDARDVDNGATDPGVVGTVSGWGYTNTATEEISNVLQKVELPIVSRFTASRVWPTIPTSFVMAGYADSGGDACRGDSGGPFVVNVDGIDKLAGIVSWGSADCNSYGAYTRVSDYLEWINSNVDEFESSLLDYPEGDKVVCYGTTESIYATNIRLGAIGYQWQIWPDSAGEISYMNDSATVTWAPNFEGRVSIRVRATVSNSLLPWSSTVVYVSKPAAVLSQPSDTSACANSPLVLSPRVQGYSHIYTWYKNGIVYDTLNTKDLVFPNVELDDAGVYSVNVASVCGDAVSEDIALTVDDVTAFVRQSNGAFYKREKGGGLSVEVVGTNLDYLWYKNDVLVEGADSSRLLLSAANNNDIGLYFVSALGTCGFAAVAKPYYYYINSVYDDLPKQINVRPTVTADEVHISVNSTLAYKIELFTLEGNLVYKKTKCQYDTTISLKGYHNGIYIIRVHSALFEGRCKLIKE